MLKQCKKQISTIIQDIDDNDILSVELALQKINRIAPIKGRIIRICRDDTIAFRHTDVKSMNLLLWVIKNDMPNTFEALIQYGYSIDKSKSKELGGPYLLGTLSYTVIFPQYTPYFDFIMNNCDMDVYKVHTNSFYWSSGRFNLLIGPEQQELIKQKICGNPRKRVWNETRSFFRHMEPIHKGVLHGIILCIIGAILAKIMLN